MITIRGIEVSNRIKAQVQEELKKLNGYIPKLAVVRVGEKPDDISYERGAVKKMESFGLKAVSYNFPETISHKEFKQKFEGINQDSTIDGILLLRPLPEQIAEADIQQMIDPKKDLDGISPVNIAKVFAGDESGFAPCTAEAVVETLKSSQVEITGKRVTIVGRSMVVGKPLAILLLKENATVTVCHTRTLNMKDACSQAEILIAAAGNARMLDQEYVGDGAVVIDVGINLDQDGKLCGDVDFDLASQKAAMITPVPGGIGTVTTAVLGRHLVEAAKALGK